MLFNSFTYIVFFTAVCLLYFALPGRYRWILLLLASYLFYSFWKIKHLVLLSASTAIVYACALLMHKYPGSRKLYLSVGVVANIGLLVVFKYIGFIVDTLVILEEYLPVHYLSAEIKIIMPIGISFYIFKAVSYLADVYRGKIEPERHFGIFALYVSFFPQLLAGPIDRSTMLLPQLKKEFGYDYNRMVEGLKLTAWGFFKKLVVADRLAMYVDKVYADPVSFQGLPILLAIYFFTLQIYSDFSGYSDIANGSAKILGYEGMENFRRPYFSRSMQEFWNRWHISLSTWFRDYLYIPLGGNRVSRLRWSMNIMAVFLLSGLWHGANWTFVIWGGIHGMLLVVGRLAGGLREVVKDRLIQIIRFPWDDRRRFLLNRIGCAWSIAVTFHLTAFAWIFFKAESCTKAASIITNIFPMKMSDISIGFSQVEFTLMVAMIPCLLFLDAVQEKSGGSHPLVLRTPAGRWASYYILILAMLFLGVFVQSKFIYFGF